MRPVLTVRLNEAMKVEPVDTQAGTLNLSNPKTAKHVDANRCQDVRDGRLYAQSRENHAEHGD
ncbi:MAG: hypothetical protein GY820_44765 [Gammaproteobacteria bacterium]|nr:hypothetical protein [Gammaproteobacteria bacterium]